ncbi:hypothetical protein DFR86_04575 [Acidianus sulfidivorans JP7]|uniref:Uncharacterized protein n=1 Tax=Acidianus sulfidivorans JP7 TaxID=619593 RepID=A0A2U9IQK1_9CREN|nr:hypothetical protein [Acidianus sulfidivorans]AWR98237.1 hypothetical protein DFR86_04575 [Acidianus sulfidivorans JP7]
MLNWRHVGKEWNKCKECWLNYKRGIQHENSLHCYKLGIPIKSLKISLQEFLNLEIVKNISCKYGVFSFPLNILSNGVLIFYFDSKEEMISFIDKIKEYIKENPGMMEKKFYDTFVNVDWIGGLNWRRGCPEYDKKFGDWRKWKNS